MLFKLMVILTTVLVIIALTGCSKPAEGTGDAQQAATPDTTATEPVSTSSEPTCKWGEWQEVDTYSDGGYFLPESMAEDYKKGTLGQWELYGFILSPSFERGVTEHPQHGVTYLPIEGGGPHISPENGNFFIHPDDWTRLNQGEKLEEIRVLWLAHVPSLEREWGKLTNANGEPPSSEWIVFEFPVDFIRYGNISQLIVCPVGHSMQVGVANYSLFALYLP